MTDKLPTVEQIDRAQVPLATAHNTALGIGYYVLGRTDAPACDVFRRSLMDSVRQAVRALGYDLVPRDGPHLVIDNDAEQPVTMGR